jgi:acyl-CoA synthetase (AMP-forming)/AMP-acid ligase II
MTSHFNMTSNLRQWLTHQSVDFADSSTTVAFVPFSHIYGLNYYHCMCMLTGASVAVMPRFDLEIYLKSI